MDLRQFALRSLWADESAGFAFCRSWEALARKGESLFKLGNTPGAVSGNRTIRPREICRGKCKYAQEEI